MSLAQAYSPTRGIPIGGEEKVMEEDAPGLLGLIAQAAFEAPPAPFSGDKLVEIAEPSNNPNENTTPTSDLTTKLSHAARPAILKRGSGKEHETHGIRKRALRELSVPIPAELVLSKESKRPSIGSDKSEKASRVTSSGVSSQNSIFHEHDEPTVDVSTRPQMEVNRRAKRHRKNRVGGEYEEVDARISYRPIGLVLPSRTEGKKKHLSFVSQITQQQMLLQNSKKQGSWNKERSGGEDCKNASTNAQVASDEHASADALLLLCRASERGSGDSTPVKRGGDAKAKGGDKHGHCDGAGENKYREGGEQLHLMCHLCSAWASRPSVDKKGYVYCYKCLRSHVKKTCKSPEGCYMNLCDITEIKHSGFAPPRTLQNVLRSAKDTKKVLEKYGDHVLSIMDEVQDLLEANGDVFSHDVEGQNSKLPINIPPSVAAQNSLLESLSSSVQAKVAEFTERLTATVQALEST